MAARILIVNLRGRAIGVSVHDGEYSLRKFMLACMENSDDFTVNSEPAFIIIPEKVEGTHDEPLSLSASE